MTSCHCRKVTFHCTRFGHLPLLSPLYSLIHFHDLLAFIWLSIIGALFIRLYPARENSIFDRICRLSIRSEAGRCQLAEPRRIITLPTPHFRYYTSQAWYLPPPSHVSSIRGLPACIRHFSGVTGIGFLRYNDQVEALHTMQDTTIGWASGKMIISASGRHWQLPPTTLCAAYISFHSLSRLPVSRQIDQSSGFRRLARPQSLTWRTRGFGWWRFAFNTVITMPPCHCFLRSFALKMEHRWVKRWWWRDWYIDIWWKYR